MRNYGDVIIVNCYSCHPYIIDFDPEVDNKDKLNITLIIKNILKGSFEVKLVKIDNWDNPSDNCKIYHFTLEEDKPQVLFIPQGYANGFKANTEQSKLMIMSNYALNEIEDDHYRFEQTKWVNWNKK